MGSRILPVRFKRDKDNGIFSREWFRNTETFCNFGGGSFKAMGIPLKLDMGEIGEIVLC